MRRLAMAMGRATVALFVARAAPAMAAGDAGRVTLGQEAYWPIHRDRQIRTLMIDVFYVRAFAGPLRFALGGGLSATHAFGEITQLANDLRAVRFETSAAGAGPALLVACEPLHFGAVGLGVDALGALLLYDRRFPPGGDIYNLAWRIGPTLAVGLGERVTLSSGVRWMHVSNGQGVRPQNPSYEAAGVLFSMTARF